MSISEEDFNLQCIEFVKKCNRSDNNWCLFDCTGGHLQEINIQDVISDEIKEKKLMLRSIAIYSVDGSLQSKEYTVIYSPSYEVPVLYYCISDQDGCPLEANKSAHSTINLEEEDLNQVLTQTEHPVLFRPFYMIHPCRTKEFMQFIDTNSNKNYLIAWLSTVATLINLKLDYTFT